MKKVNLSDIIIPKLYPLFQDMPEVEDVIVTSGRAGTKSSALAIRGDYGALSQETAIVFMRKNHNKLKNTVFAESKRAFSRLGVRLDKAGRTTVSPMQIKIKHNGSVIFFTGSDNPDDTKGMIDETHSISMVMVDEITEFFKMGYDRGKEELEQIKSTFIRGNDEDFKMYYAFNPPKNPNAPVMKWVNEKKFLHDEDGNVLGLNPKVLHIHVTYLDVPVEWLGKRLVASAEEMKRVDEEYYRWLWLGESIGVEDVIFHMFDPKKHIVDYNCKPLYNIGIGVDYGQKNATTFNAFGIDRENKRLQGILSYKHSGRTQKPKSPSEYAQDMVEFIKEVEKLTKDRVTFITIDPSAEGFAEEIKQALRRERMNIPIRKAQNSVAIGISRVQSLLSHQALVLDSSMVGAIEEFGLYSYDPKSIERGEEKPIKDNDHDMDGIRYLVMEQWQSMNNIIRTLEEIEVDE